MKHEMSKAMFDRNTKQGILIYLSKFGFDTNRPIDYEKGPTKKTVFAVQEDTSVVEKPTRRVPKFEQSVLKRSVKKKKKIPK